MTREEIRQFNYNALVELSLNDPKVKEAIEKEGYSTKSIFFFVTWKPSYLNGRFKLAARRVYQNVVLPDAELLAQYKDLSIMLPK